MAENDINNEEQYKIAANKINDYYKNNKLLVENIYKKENKNSSFEDIEDKGKVMSIYNSFKSSYSLEELQQYNDEDILNKYIFTKGNKDNLCYKLEFAIKVGGIGQSSVFSKYGLCKNETGWHLGSSSKNSESINKERAIKEGKKQIDFIVKGGRLIEKYIKDNKLYNIANYDELDSELGKETSELSTKPWVRKYYHLLFPDYFCNWFSDYKLSDVLTKLGITNQSKTYYGKCGQLMKIYKNTGLDNPVLVMFICIALLDIKKEINDDNDNVRYWLYSPGNDAEDWEEHYKKGIMAIGKDAIGNLAVFKSKEEMKQKMQETLKPQKNYTKSANMSWQFVHVMKPGDIVFAKKGRKTIIGRGIVSGNYKYVVNRKHHKNIRYIHWTHKKNYDFSEELFSMNTLINISKIELINKIEALFKDENFSNSKNQNNSNKTISSHLNQILYGPPGTGKTYNTVVYAVAICDGKSLEEVKNEEYQIVFKRFKELKNSGRIAFTTFHQSYAYEEFIEGIKPVFNDDPSNSEISKLKYTLDKGIFRNFCDNISEKVSINALNNKKIYEFNDNTTIWKVSLYESKDNPIREECLKNGHIRIGWDEYGADIKDDNKYEGKSTLNSFINLMQKGDIVISCYSQTIVDAIGIITGDYEWDDSYDNYKRVRKVNWIIKDKIDIKELNYRKNMVPPTIYRMTIKVSDVKRFLTEKYPEKFKTDNKNTIEPYVFIIDEINRGNISKIFGELITLIEEDKRESFSVRLPYSHEEFTVPKNLYIIGTMNTSDRSIASIDIALRRRFTFKEMMPDSELVADFGIEFKKIFEELNNRIRILLDRDHQIGHSYFIKDKYENGDIENLKEIWFNSIMPLLNEYFYNDWEKLRALLGKAKLADDNHKYPSFVKKIEKVDFADSDYQCDEEEQYDFVSDTEIDFEKALNHAFSKKSS